MIYTSSSRALLMLSLIFTLFSCGEDKPRKILVFNNNATNKAVGYEAVKRIMEFGKNRQLEIDTTSDKRFLSEDTLKNYGALILVNTKSNGLDAATQNDIQRFIEAGGGLAGIHAGGSTTHQWPLFSKIVGGVIETKANSDSASQISINVIDDDLSKVDNMPKTWSQQDAMLKVNSLDEDNTTVAMANDKPVSWHRKYEGSKIFYTLAGGDQQSYSNENFVNHVLDGIQYVASGSALDYGKAKTLRVPEANRFLPIVLDSYLDEPIEMEILDNGKVIFIERHGNVKIYDPSVKASKVIGKLDVQLSGNYEDGLLGLEIDPNFNKNQFIYLYYSPLGGKPVQNLSRFKLNGDTLMMNSEKLVIEVPVQRETCCHSAGNVYFSKDGNLYLSTGDNTSSKESDGFTPIDERAGRAPFDAQKSSGNTHDLRGKILRIHVEADGTYTIPEGNLFPKDGSKGRPEIYVMGARNPYRLTVDNRGFLYWGDVGPDGGQDSERGPRSYDEWNQARKPGYFGWPYFLANNIAYADFDFEKNVIGAKFNPENPVNESPNNNGSKTLPPAQPAMIYYPYNESSEFPMLGTGSRSAMSGPFYYQADYKDSNAKFPKYYDEKLFIFEWARSWIKVLTFNKEGDLQQIESFLPEMEFYHPIDVKFGADGAMYVLNYGANYFARNPDAQLVRIEYAEGNRQPVAQIVADKTVGAVPLKINFSAKKSFDYDANAKLTYAWDSGEGETSREPEPVFTFDKEGVYRASLTVTDESGASAKSEVEIKVGNEMPTVDVELNGNRSFYLGNSPLSYQVSVQDKEDGNLQNGIDPKQVSFAIDYLSEGNDLALLASHAADGVSAKYLKGKALMDESDCKSCHALNQKSIGPSLNAVAQRYKVNVKAVPMLVNKIIGGGNGNWGTIMMAAHPQLSEKETEQMVNYILSLADQQKNLPLKGVYNLKEHKATDATGVYIFSARYVDKGSDITGKLTGRKMIILRNPKVQAEDFNKFHEVGTQRPVGADLAYVSEIKDGSYISFSDIDLNGVGEIAFNVQANTGEMEVRIDSSEGSVIGNVNLASQLQEWRTINVKIKNTEKPSDLYIVFKNSEGKRPFMNMDWLVFKK